MKLDPTAFARRAVEFSRQAAAEASRNASHAERISISDPARDASRDTARPARGDVRWYRAAHGAAARKRGAKAIDDPPWRAGSAARAPAATGGSAPRNARAAIAAYLANMPLAA